MPVFGVARGMPSIPMRITVVSGRWSVVSADQFLLTTDHRPLTTAFSVDAEARSGVGGAALIAAVDEDGYGHVARACERGGQTEVELEDARHVGHRQVGDAVARDVSRRVVAQLSEPDGDGSPRHVAH